MYIPVSNMWISQLTSIKCAYSLATHAADLEDDFSEAHNVQRGELEISESVRDSQGI